MTKYSVNEVHQWMSGSQDEAISRLIGWCDQNSWSLDVVNLHAKSLMEEFAPKFDAALLFEPPLPDGSLVAARKGSGNFSIVVRGKSTHAGWNSDQGRNAVVHRANLIP